MVAKNVKRPGEGGARTFDPPILAWNKNTDKAIVSKKLFNSVNSRSKTG
jgi:hypothetical protein